MRLEVYTYAGKIDQTEVSCDQLTCQFIYMV